MNKTIIAISLYLLFFTNMSQAYIDAAVSMDLVGGRKVILIFDAYKGYSEDANKLHALSLIGAVKKITLECPDRKLDLSYEDPGVYEAGHNLKKFLPLLEEHASNLPNDSYLSLVPPVNGLLYFDVMSFKNPPMLSTYLAGFLTQAVAMMDKDYWPADLTIHSNDPRNEHYLALTKNQEWLLKHKEGIRMRTLITAAPLLKAKRAVFTIDKKLSEDQQDKINKILTDFEQTEKDQLEAFANFTSIETKQEIDVSLLEQTIDQVKDKIPLDVVHKFLSTRKERTDVYSDAPIVDTLLTMFNERHPNNMIIVLGNHLAKKLLQTLDKLGVVEEGCDIKDAANYFLKLAMDECEICVDTKSIYQ